MSRRRVLLGFLVAPGAPGLAASLAAAVLYRELAALALMLAFLAYIAAAVLGVPAYLYARSRGLPALKRRALLAVNIALGAYVLIGGFVTVLDATASPFKAVMAFLASLMLLLVPAFYAACSLWLFRWIVLRGAEGRFDA